ncbi:MAG: DUF3386 domain-containing protein [Xenococcaceae cyanobacterium]
MGQKLKRRILSWGLTLILAIASLTLGLPNIARASSAGEAFRAAYENRYTWDEQFPGYSAEVSINYQGELDRGIVRVKPDLSVEVINIDEEEVRQFIANQLRMEVIHHRRIPFEVLHRQNRFDLEGTDENGALKIREVGDEMDSYYKVQDRVITQVNRILGNMAVTVDTIGTNKTPEGYLVSQFQTTFRDGQTGEVLQKEDVRDVREKIGNYYLLTSREIRITVEDNPGAKLDADWLIVFKNIQPLLTGNYQLFEQSDRPLILSIN